MAVITFQVLNALVILAQLQNQVKDNLKKENPPMELEIGLSRRCETCGLFPTLLLEQR